MRSDIAFRPVTRLLRHSTQVSGTPTLPGWILMKTMCGLQTLEMTWLRGSTVCPPSESKCCKHDCWASDCASHATVTRSTLT